MLYKYGTTKTSDGRHEKKRRNDGFFIFIFLALFYLFISDFIRGDERSQEKGREREKESIRLKSNRFENDNVYRLIDIGRVRAKGRSTPLARVFLLHFPLPLAGLLGN